MTKVVFYPFVLIFILSLPFLSEWAAEKGMVRVFDFSFMSFSLSMISREPSCL